MLIEGRFGQQQRRVDQQGNFLLFCYKVGCLGDRESRGFELVNKSAIDLLELRLDIDGARLNLQLGEHVGVGWVDLHRQ